MRDTSYGRGSGFGRPGKFRSFRPKPVEVGKEYEATITEVSRRGDGVARLEGFVIFVLGTRAGQKVRVRINGVGNRFASSEVVSDPLKANSRKINLRSLPTDFSKGCSMEKKG